jgi:hypothetical protein
VRGELHAGRSLGHVVIAVVTLPGGLVSHHEHLRDHSPNPERRADAERVLEDLRSLCRAAQAFEEQHELWRQQFQSIPPELAPAGTRRTYLACRLIVTLPV